MEATTIKLQEATKHQLDKYKEYKNETYDEVVRKLVYIVENCETEPELSSETIEAIERARERIQKGKFVTEKEARLRLGL